jgi:ComF family protein
MGRILTILRALLYPKRCPSCAVIVEEGESFCSQCLPYIQPITSPYCSCCGVPFITHAGPDHLCGPCLREPPPFHQARAWAYYQHGADRLQPVSDAIQQFKYHRDLSVGKTLALLAALQYPFASESYDVIIPVPLHLKRLRWRGFNQALLLSQAIGTAHGVTVDPFLLERVRPTVPQTQLTGKERRTNVNGAFTVPITERLLGKRVLLVDDVYTSGATVHECARVLTQAGAQVVDVFTLARAVS